MGKALSKEKLIVGGYNETNMLENMLLKMMNRFTIKIMIPSAIGTFIKRFPPERLEEMARLMDNGKTRIIVSTLNGKQIIAMVANMTGEQIFSIMSGMGEIQMGTAISNMPSDSISAFVTTLDGEKTGAMIRGLTREKVAAITKALTAGKMGTIVRSLSPENMAVIVRGMSPGMIADFMGNSSVDVTGAMFMNLTSHKAMAVLSSLDIEYWKKISEYATSGDLLNLLKGYSTMIHYKKLIDDLERVVVSFGGDMMDRFLGVVGNPRFQGMLNSLTMSFVQTMFKPRTMTKMGGEMGKVMPAFISSTFDSLFSSITGTISGGVDQVQEIVKRIGGGK